MLRTGLILAALGCAALLTIRVADTVAVEEAPYTVLKRDGDIELRDYAAQLRAEVVVDTDFDGAGGAAFRTLARYIGGANQGSRRIAMTAPVVQEAAGTRIAMTTPVTQEPSDAGWAVAFLLPADFTLDSAPEPADPAVTLRRVPPQRMAAIRYSGRWTRSRYDDALARLRAWLQSQGLEAAGAPVWARHNGPFTPWFLRRNEVLLPLDAAP